MVFPALTRGSSRLLFACNRVRQSSNGVSSKVLPYKQDLPPVGGYAEFDMARIPQSPFPSPNKQFIGYIIISAIGWVWLNWAKDIYRREKLELLDAKVAITPLLVAERDRLYLRRIRRNFEAETELMKDVPGWEVGKWYNEPVYKTVPQGMWIDPQSWEYWAHSKPFEYDQWLHWWHYT